MGNAKVTKKRMAMLVAAGVIPAVPAVADAQVWVTQEVNGAPVMGYVLTPMPTAPDCTPNKHWELVNGIAACVLNAAVTPTPAPTPAPPSPAPTPVANSGQTPVDGPNGPGDTGDDGDGGAGGGDGGGDGGGE